MASDRELLEAWREGDATAGEALFERYYGLVSRFFANKVTQDPADLIQETFLGCVRGRERIRDDDHFRSYLFGTAYNVLRQHQRDRYAADERFDPGRVSCADLAPGVGTLLGRGDEERLLLAGLRRIPLEFQVVLELFYWEDMTSAAIAQLLDEPHGTVRTRLRRARELLEAALRELTHDPGLLQRTTSDLDGWAARVRALAYEAHA
ncbi:MAG: sigma-70 family RNA polymerase sigma factor [Nannocystaceae bacterium]|nr:sigma-70 family RNA polymerase sigma factor [Nannocystaceae bacterium]